MWLSLTGLCAAVLSLAGVYLYLDPQTPKAETYRNVKLETPLRVYAEDGALIAEFGERRLIPLALQDVPQDFINALLDTEDKRFYEHSGIDFISLTNDVFGLVGDLLIDGEVGGGASTITMQLARNVSFSLERRFLRKFKEMLLALKIERELTKQEILELYVNLVPFGKRAYGAEAAARTYYGKSLAELNLAQLAMLAGIPQAPTAGNPINGPQRALARRNLVLSRMRAQNSINQAQFEAAVAAPISANVFARDLDAPSPYPAEWVRQLAITFVPDLYTGGYEIYTTIDADLQQEAIAAVRRGLHAYDEKHGYRGVEGQLPAALIEQLNTVTVPKLTPDSGVIETTLTESGAQDKNQPAQLITAALTPDPANDDETLQQIYPEPLQAAIRATLAQQPVSRELTPAAVLALQDNQALVQLLDGQFAQLDLADAAWARPYIEVNLRGPQPKQWSELLNVGDVIRVRQLEDRWQLTQVPEIQGALVALDPENGKVRALVGGFDFYRNQYNHALQAARQPGSGFKPFVYSAALANGVTPADVFLDAPLVFKDALLEEDYRPNNDDNQYNGPTRLREALYRSINLVSMRVLLQVGAGNVMEHVSKFGFSVRNFPRNTQLAIGGGTMAITPIDMARSYAVLANGGYLIQPHIIERIVDIEGNTILQASHPVVCKTCEDDEAIIDNEEPEAIEPATLEELLAQDDNIDGASDTQPIELAPRVIDERNAYVMHSMMRDVIRRGTGFAAYRALQRNDLAGKTGTTNDAADTWFNGYHPSLVTTVWVGFSNHEPLGATAYGSNTPLPIWIDFMQDALQDVPESLPAQPPGVVTVKIDPKTGQPASAGQRDAIFEYFLEEHVPTRSDETDTTPNTAQDDEEIKSIDLF